MVTRTFQRTKYFAYVKLGSRQKSMRKYRRPTGRHNKSRQKWKSRPPMVEIGYKTKGKTRGMINNKTPVIINNLEELKKLNPKENIAIIAKIGRQNKMEIAKEALAKKIEIYNLNANKFIKEYTREEKIKLKEEQKETPKKEETKKEEKKTEVKEETKTEHKQGEKTT